MPIPDYQSIMLPLLQYASDDQEHSNRDTIAHLAQKFALTDAERSELLPSGTQATFNNRVGWAKTYMAKAGLLDMHRRAHFKITARRHEVLASRPAAINVALLEQFDEFIAFRQTKREKIEETSTPKQALSETPEETLEAAHQLLRQELTSEILQTIHDCSPEFFERLVVDLLINMGYGGSRKEAGQATKATHGWRWVGPS